MSDTPHIEGPDGTCTDECVATHPEHASTRGEPERIPEPGWGAIVEAGVKQHDVRLYWTQLKADHWLCRDADEYDRRWGDLIDPVLIREGIS